MENAVTTAPPEVTKTQKARALTIARREKKFKAATMAERRVMIARDVLAQLRAQKIQARCGIYYQAPIGFTSDGEQQLRDVAPVCTACAKGALFACKVSFVNNITVGQSRSRWDFDMAEVQNTQICAYLRPEFSRTQLALVEWAFEVGAGVSCPTGISQVTLNKAVAFGMAHQDSALRLRAIMRNIIENGGTFRP